MPRIGVLHKCSAFRHRIEARLDDRLALTMLAWMLQSGSEETTTEAGPANSRARITPICAASPLTTAARGRPSLEPPAHLPVPFDENQLLLSDPPLDQRLGDTSGPAAEFDHRPLAPSRLHARACHRPGKRPRARHDPPDPVRARRPTPDEERDPGLHPRQTPADAGWEAAVCGESSSVIHGVRYCSTLYDYTAGGEALCSLTERSSKGVGDGR